MNEMQKLREIIEEMTLEELDMVLQTVEKLILAAEKGNLLQASNVLQ